MTRTARWLLSCFALASLGASCGETNIQAIRRLEPRGGQLRRELSAIAAALPPPGSVTETRPPTSPFVPPFVLDYAEDVSTADVLMEAQLRSPERDSAGTLDLLLSVDLLSCLLWTGPNNPLDPSVWDDSTGLGADCERAFSVRWLVVVRPAAYELPERVGLELFVVDMLRRRVVAEIPIELRGRYTKADLGRGRWASDAERQLRSDAFVVARCAIARKLEALPGARVRFRSAWLDSPDPCAKLPATFREVSPLRSAR